MASLFSGTPLQATSYTTSASETPKWMQDAIYNQIQWSTNVAQKPFEAYGKPLVANFDPLRQQAVDTVQNNVGNWQQPYQQAESGMQDLSQAKSVDNVDQYMNPYMNNVTDRIAQLGARNLNEVLLPGVSDSFTRAGQFGSSRMGEFGSRALRDTQDSILGQQSNALQQGYGQALNASQADLSRQQQATGALSQIAQQGQAMGAADASALESAGLTRQQQDQAVTDKNYQQFVEQRDYPKSTLDWLSTQVRGMAPITDRQTAQSTQSSGTTYSPSPLSQIGSIVSAGSGLYNMNSKEIQK